MDFKKKRISDAMERRTRMDESVCDKHTCSHWDASFSRGKVNSDDVYIRWMVDERERERGACLLG